jgi:DNA polymerase
MIQCNNCALRKNSIQVVPGVGPADAKVMIIGEAPGADEDQQGIPFSGRAGQLLTQLIQQAGGDRANIFVTNVVKCRPLKNRDPEPGEIQACWRYLYNQLLIIRPKVVLTVGRISTEQVLTQFSPSFDPRQFRITKDHGKPFTANIAEHNYMFKLIPIMHTAYLLRGEKLGETQATIQDLNGAFQYAYQTP